jgi:hypothetical protein
MQNKVGRDLLYLCKAVIEEAVAVTRVIQQRGRPACICIFGVCY